VLTGQRGVFKELSMPYELYYWPNIQGRGEFVRLALEEAGEDYVDVARSGDAGMAEMMKILKDDTHSPFAPPFLKDGDILISHVANILLYLGPKLHLAPRSEKASFFAHGLQLTITDFVAEAHDVHHPISTELYYEDQIEEAKARSQYFIKLRIPKFLAYFESILMDNSESREFAIGVRLTYVDLSLFQVIEGLHYAFPRALKTFASKYPALDRLRDKVRERPNIARYLESERRIPFNESGVFRHYPELDKAPRSK
jgi:glutathione S-transferase